MRTNVLPVRHAERINVITLIAKLADNSNKTLTGSPVHLLGSRLEGMDLVEERSSRGKASSYTQ